MNSTSLQAQLMALLRFDRAQVLEVRAASEGPAPQLNVGQKVEALVEARAPDNRVLLKVEGALVQAKLPDSVSAQVGQRLPLTVSKLEPVLTFLVQSELETSAPASSARVNVSELAARISQLVESRSTTSSSPATSVAPLLAEPTLDAEALVLPLKTALERSGLFYESHQAQWVSGQRSKEALQAEPQAKWVSAKESAPQPGMRSVNERGVEVSALLQQKDGVSASTAPTSTINPMATSAADDPVTVSAQQMAPMLERQVHTLASQTAVWQGQLWPGQSMLWEVEERQPETANAEAESAWRSRIKLTLPRLGEVEAVLDLSGDQLRVRIVSNTEHMQLFFSERSPFQSALAVRGIELRELEVKRHGENT